MSDFSRTPSRAKEPVRDWKLRAFGCSSCGRTVYKVRKENGQAIPGEDDDGPDLLPGEERLNSFWSPSLIAGPEYMITAEQTVAAPTADKPLLLAAKQPFTVDAPRFSLPEGSVYSKYPPPGYPEEHRILPHIVLSDPHLPWERVGSPSTEHTPDERSRVPWLVLLSFTQDELKLEQGSLKGFGQFKQTSTLSIKMKVGDLRGITNAANPITDADFPGVSENTGEFIFMKSNLFKSLFSTFDKDNKRVEKEYPDTQQYKFLSHVRKVNTTGMAVGGTEDVGIFSIVVGNRAGTLHNKTPATVAVHLVSIEGVEKMKFPGADKDYVSLCSLHSWNYTVMPPNTLNVYDTFVALGSSLSVLRPPNKLIDSLKGGDRVQVRLAKRLTDGYSLVKYCLQTGEPTMAFYRGPFTPVVVPRNPHFDTCSNSGQEFQTLDQQLGIIDVTYSSAWNVGRVLAAGDQSFTSALTRFRSAIHAAAIKKAKLHAIADVEAGTGFRTRRDVLRDIKSTFRKLNNIHRPHLSDDDDDQDPGSGGPLPRLAPKDRWFRPRLGKKQYPSLGLENSKIIDSYAKYAKEVALDLAMAKDGTVYNETNSPLSTDWMVILAWVMDRMFLSGVPAHYLLSDPSHLTPESLKFFYIDPNWVDAMIDGALSLGNEKGTDMDRAAIKCAINRYVEHLPPEQKHRPQIPTYGFYLRSDVVTMFPDLRVETLPPHVGERPEKAPLLRHEIVADGVMMALFDRVPGSAEFKGLKFTQPPHQQCFAVANSLAADHITINIRKQYTVTKEERRKDPSDPHEPFKPPIKKSPTDSDNFFLWNSVPKAAAAEGSGDRVAEDDLRMVRVPYFAEKQLEMCRERMGSFKDEGGQQRRFFDDDTANSALLAMQLTDPIYFLQVDFRDKGRNAPVPELASLQQPPPTAESTGPPDEEGEEEGEAQQLLPQPVGLRTLHFLLEDLFRDGERGFSQWELPTCSLDTPSIPRSPRPSRMTSSSDDSLEEGPTGSADPAGPPDFRCAVYSPQDRVVVLDKDGLRQDLVFSVLVGNRESNYLLREFVIAVPLGSTKTTGMNMLMETYDGPGATMLSNLRFNVLTSFGTLERPNVDALMLRLVPRSSSGYVSVKKVFELGFLLNLARLNRYEPGERVVTLYTREYYTDDRMVHSQFNVVLQNNNVVG
ncbi:hypothetical protein VUR80DRAFT_4625 [Thermomyces stellatus]